MDVQDSLYRAQIEQLKDYAVFFIDAQGVIRTWNAGVEQLFGYSKEEWIGQDSSIIFTPADQASSLREAETCIAREQLSASDIRWHRKKDGTELFANGVMSCVYDEEGKLQGYTKVIADETARKNLEDSLVKANAALEHFAYTASHDLQEPLRIIGIYAELLLRQSGKELSRTGTEYLQVITGAVGQMNALIQSLLNYARVGVEEEPAVLASLDIDLESALSQLAGVIQDSGAMVTHDPLPLAKGEHTQIVRLFLNLIGNSLKYRAPERAPEVHVSAACLEDGWVTISITDNGIGFAHEYAEKIFNPFIRLHGRQYSGSGVGLAICRRIVERRGGRIWADSTPGKGSTFRFTLPSDAKNQM